MHKDQERRSREQSPDPSQPELNSVWRELLGGQFPQSLRPHEQGTATPVLSNDPWKTLTQARGIEEIDLQQIDLHVSDQEIEQALQVMQEQQKPASGESGATKER